MARLTHNEIERVRVRVRVREKRNEAIVNSSKMTQSTRLVQWLQSTRITFCLGFPYLATILFLHRDGDPLTQFGNFKTLYALQRKKKYLPYLNHSHYIKLHDNNFRFEKTIVTMGVSHIEVKNRLEVG